MTATVLATSLAQDGATTPSVSHRCRVAPSDSHDTGNHQASEIVEAREQWLARQRARCRECLASESAEERETLLSRRQARDRARRALASSRGKSTSSNYETPSSGDKCRPKIGSSVRITSVDTKCVYCTRDKHNPKAYYNNNMHPSPVPTTANQLGHSRSPKCLALHWLCTYTYKVVQLQGT